MHLENLSLNFPCSMIICNVCESLPSLTILVRCLLLMSLLLENSSPLWLYLKATFSIAETTENSATYSHFPKKVFVKVSQSRIAFIRSCICASSFKSSENDSVGIVCEHAVITALMRRERYTKWDSYSL